MGSIAVWMRFLRCPHKWHQQFRVHGKTLRFFAIGGIKYYGDIFVLARSVGASDTILVQQRWPEGCRAMNGMLQYDGVFRKGCVDGIWDLPGKNSPGTELKSCRNLSFF
jgi:hypothetical protein